MPCTGQQRLGPRGLQSDDPRGLQPQRSTLKFVRNYDDAGLEDLVACRACPGRPLAPEPGGSHPPRSWITCEMDGWGAIPVPSRPAFQIPSTAVAPALQTPAMVVKSPPLTSPGSGEQFYVNDHDG